MGDTDEIFVSDRSVTLPEHVPESLYYDFDFVSDPALLASPHARVADLLENAPPMFWTPRQGGHWVFTKYAVNVEAARDWESFSSQLIPIDQVERMKAALPPDWPRIPQPVPVAVDPPLHGQYRTPLRTLFAPSAVLGMKDLVAAAADELVDGVFDQGGCDFMETLALKLPVEIFLKVMGLPVERRQEYQNLLEEKLSESGLNDITRAARSLLRVVDVTRDTLIARRDDPQDDIISKLWQWDMGGRSVTMTEMEDFTTMLFVAGLDTIVTAMGYLAFHLASDPDLQEELRRDPAKIPRAVEETLRRYGFVNSPRRVTRDLEFRGVQLKENERVILYLPASSLDPDKFAHPETIDLDRESNNHLAFNSGPHKCVGLHLARVELQALCEVLLARLPNLRLDAEKPPRFAGGFTLALHSLHLQW